MAFLIPIKYNRRSYPDGIQAIIREIPGHLDVISIERTCSYSLHTEYSAGSRKLDSVLLQRYKALRTSNIHGVPQLWHDSLWAEEFSEFIQAIVGDNVPPLVIEIHPPFNDYCPSLDEFCSIYRIFEERILSVYTQTEILIENRFGTRYKNGNFLVSSYQDVISLVSRLERLGLRLKIVLDVPQLLSQMGDTSRLTRDKLEAMFVALQACRSKIKSVHLWGKRRNDAGRLCAHVGNLDTYFEGNIEMKEHFLRSLHELLHDGLPRYFVPEVNSSALDVAAIVKDLQSAGFVFINIDSKS